jgi:hypothetical protein
LLSAVLSRVFTESSSHTSSLSLGPSFSLCDHGSFRSVHYPTYSMKFLSFFSALTLGVSLVSARSPQHVNKKLSNLRPRAPAPAPEDIHQYKPRKASPSSRFLTEKTKKYVVNGTNIPDVDFDVSCLYPRDIRWEPAFTLAPCSTPSLGRHKLTKHRVDWRELRWAHPY